MEFETNVIIGYALLVVGALLLAGSVVLLLYFLVTRKCKCCKDERDKSQKYRVISGHNGTPQLVELPEDEDGLDANVLMNPKEAILESLHQLPDEGAFTYEPSFIDTDGAHIHAFQPTYVNTADEPRKLSLRSDTLLRRPSQKSGFRSNEPYKHLSNASSSTTHSPPFLTSDPGSATGFLASNRVLGNNTWGSSKKKDYVSSVSEYAAPVGATILSGYSTWGGRKTGANYGAYEASSPPTNENHWSSLGRVPRLVVNDEEPMPESTAIELYPHTFVDQHGNQYQLMSSSLPVLPRNVASSQPVLPTSDRAAALALDPSQLMVRSGGSLYGGPRYAPGSRPVSRQPSRARSFRYDGDPYVARAYAGRGREANVETQVVSFPSPAPSTVNVIEGQALMTEDGPIVIRWSPSMRRHETASPPLSESLTAVDQHRYGVSITVAGSGGHLNEGYIRDEPGPHRIHGSLRRLADVHL